MANPPIKFRLSIPSGLMHRYEFEPRMMLMPFTISLLFNFAHFQNQRKTAVYCV
jgi:hypothetical protein